MFPSFYSLDAPIPKRSLKSAKCSSVKNNLLIKAFYHIDAFFSLCYILYMRIVTLLTDFGLKDGNVGVMKGVILDIIPNVKIADISHYIQPQNVQQGAVVIERASAYFPPDTVHVLVVDPGVGTARRAIAAHIGNQYYVAPDNGILTYVIKRAEDAGDAIEIVNLNQPAYWLPEVSNVFHGRDIFSPVGAHIANGVPLSRLGDPIDDVIRIRIPVVEVADNALKGEIIIIDNFGNLLTNILREHLDSIENPLFQVGDFQIKGLAQTFGSKKPGELVAVIGEANELTISVVNGNAQERTRAQLGDVIEVRSQ